MRRHVGAILVGISIVGPGAARAATGQAATGTIAHVDSTARTLTLTVNHHDEVFVVSPETRLQRGAQTVGLDDLAAWSGIRAKVRYVDQDGARKAQSVMVSRDRLPAQDLSGSPPASGITSPKRSAIR